MTDLRSTLRNGATRISSSAGIRSGGPASTFSGDCGHELETPPNNYTRGRHAGMYALPLAYPDGQPQVSAGRLRSCSAAPSTVHLCSLSPDASYRLLCVPAEPGGNVPHG